MTRLPRLLALFALLALIASPSILDAQNNLPVCPLIATGGTIAMKIDPVKKAPVPAISGEDLGQRFLGSNHIRRRRQVCMTKCG